MSHNHNRINLGLTDSEVAQLRNINTTTISPTQWSYLGDANQSLLTTDAATFGSIITTPGGLASASTIRCGGNIIPYTTGTNMNIYGSESASGRLILHSTSHATKGSVRVDETTGSIDPTSGCLVIAGGVGIGQNVNTAGTLTVASSIDSTSSITGSTILSGGVGVAKKLYVGQSINANSGATGGVYITPNKPGWTNYESFIGIDGTITATASIGSGYLAGYHYYGILDMSTFGTNAKDMSHFYLEPTTSVNSNMRTVASMYLKEPTITQASGTITNASTLFIQNSPTEGVNNYALYIESGSALLQDIACYNISATNPAGASIKETSSYTTVADATGGIQLLVPLSEVYDPSTLWSPNTDATNGHFEYTGSLTRLYDFHIVFSISTSSGAASSLIMNLQQDQGSGTWTNVSGGEVDCDFSSILDATTCSMTPSFSTAQNTGFRFVLTSNNATTRYTIKHITICISQKL